MDTTIFVNLFSLPMVYDILVRTAYWLWCCIFSNAPENLAVLRAPGGERSQVQRTATPPASRATVAAPSTPQSFVSIQSRAGPSTREASAHILELTLAELQELEQERASSVVSRLSPTSASDATNQPQPSPSPSPSLPPDAHTPAVVTWPPRSAPDHIELYLGKIYGAPDGNFRLFESAGSMRLDAPRLLPGAPQGLDVFVHRVTEGSVQAWLFVNGHWVPVERGAAHPARPQHVFYVAVGERARWVKEGTFQMLERKRRNGAGMTVQQLQFVMVT
ncbi:hypothetical protein BC834DRAFT_418359 [Gloeopeniophorella convolvens]|nr:hypothetical protein BC834DRAFT_418359 [Gloeopeniophorella convolvens]